MAWKDGIVSRLRSGVAGLLKKGKVKIVAGAARFRDGKTIAVETETGLQIIRAEAIVIATGSAPVELPALPFGGPVISSTQALALDKVPQKLVVVGGGYIGLELGTAFAKMGAAVTVVEAMARILPLYDAELTRPVAKRLSELGVKTLTGAKAQRAKREGRRAVASRPARRRTSGSPPTRFSSPSAAGRSPRGGAARSWCWTWTARSSASTTNAAPRCAASMQSAT